MSKNKDMITRDSLPITYHLIKGNIFKDQRGTIQFVNDFKFSDVKRFYITENATTEEIRAWQGHKTEKKYFYAITGEFVIGLVKIDNWENPSKILVAEKIILSDRESQVLEIPPGYANGLRALKPNSKLLIFSDKTLEEADKYVYDKNLWIDWFDLSDE